MELLAFEYAWSSCRFGIIVVVIITRVAGSSLELLLFNKRERVNTSIMRTGLTNNLPIDLESLSRTSWLPL